MTGVSAGKPNPRDGALDALRGIAVLGMVIVNLQGSGEATFPILAHAPWDGLTFADIVFPMFLLASGLALPLALDHRSPPVSAGRIAKRAALLFLIGLAIGALIGGIVHATADIAQVRVSGVLQRIAIVWLICAIVCRGVAGWKMPVLLALALLIAHGLLLYVPAPGEAMASLAQGQGMTAWLDRALLPGRLFRETWDPEGPLSTLSAIATGMIGVAVQRMSMGEGAEWGRALPVTIGAAALCLGLGAIAMAWWPLNKALWTPSFALGTAGIGLVLLALLRAAWPAMGETRIARFVATLGRDALTLYVVHALLTALLVIKIGGERIWALSFAALGQLGLPPGWTSLLYALIGGALSIAITFALKRRGLQLRV